MGNQTSKYDPYVYSLEELDAMDAEKAEYVEKGWLPETSGLSRPPTIEHIPTMDEWRADNWEDSKEVFDYLASQETTKDAWMEAGSSWGSFDPVEDMRDSRYRMLTALSEAGRLENAPEHIKLKAAKLNESFDRAVIRGGNEQWSAFVDIGTDLITAPETVIGVLLGMATGGGSTAAQAGAMTGVKGAAQVGAFAAAKNVAKKMAVRGLSAGDMTSKFGFPLVTGSWAATDSAIQQKRDVAIGLRDEISIPETLGAFGLGVGAGKFLQVAASPFMRKAAVAPLITEQSPRVMGKVVNRLLDDPVFSRALDNVDVGVVNVSRQMDMFPEPTTPLQRDLFKAGISPEEKSRGRRQADFFEDAYPEEQAGEFAEQLDLFNTSTGKSSLVEAAATFADKVSPQASRQITEQMDLLKQVAAKKPIKDQLDLFSPEELSSRRLELTEQMDAFEAFVKETGDEDLMKQLDMFKDMAKPKKGVEPKEQLELFRTKLLPEERPNLKTQMDIEDVVPAEQATPEMVDETVDYLRKLTESISMESESIDKAIASVTAAMEEALSVGKRLFPEDIKKLKEIRDYVARNGGGEETLDLVSEKIATVTSRGASANATTPPKTRGVGPDGESPKGGPDGPEAPRPPEAPAPPSGSVAAVSEEGVEGEVGGILNRLGSRVTSKILWGKQPGFLTSYAKISAMARELQSAISPEFAKVWSGAQDYIPPSLFEVYKGYSGNWMGKYMATVEPIAKEGLRNKTLGKMDATANDLVHRAMRGEDVGDKMANTIGANLKNLYSEIGDKLLSNGLIREKLPNYVHRMWHREHIMAKPDKFKRLLVSEGQAADMAEADAIFKSMMDKRNQLDDSDMSTQFFSKARTFDKIKDDSKFAEFFEQDVRVTMASYIHQASKAIAKKERLGVSNLKEFQDRIANPIIDQVREKAGEKLSLGEYKALQRHLDSLYKSVTSEGLERFSPAGEMVSNSYGLATRVSLLGMATVSSLTEFMLNVPKAGFRNSIKGMAAASRSGFKILTGDTEGILKNNFGLTAKEAKRELYENGLALEHGLMSISNRLVGDELTSEGMNKVTNAFFKLTLLDQWTKFVQSTSFVTGKQLIASNLEALAAHGDRPMTRRMTQKVNELKELNVNIEEGIRWHNAGQSTDDDFYGVVKRGAARYTDEVILQPSSMSGQKPALYNNPKTAWMFQLMTYPTAFTNTVLKGTAKKLYRDKSPEGAARVVAAGVIMTEMQRVLNYYRSEGASEEDGEGMAYLRAIERWGAFTTAGDQFRRAAEASKYIGNPAPYLGIPFGVAGSDVGTIWSQGPVTFLGQRLFPGYTNPLVISREGKQKYKRMLREIDKKLAGENDKYTKRNY